MLRAYLSKLFLSRLLASLFGLAAILQLLDLLDRIGAILTRGGAGGVGFYVALRLPTLLGEMMPLAALLGALLTFMRLAGGLETTAMRAAGLSLWHVLWSLMPACLLVSGLEFVLQNEVAPRTERAFADWWAATAPADTPAPDRVWLRSHGDVAAIDGVSRNGKRLTGLMIVQRSAAGTLSARLDARSADYGAGRWTLHDVRIDRTDRDTAETRADLRWPQGPLPANMAELARPTDSQTLGRLSATLRGRWIGVHGAPYYRTQLQSLIVALLDPFLMVLLAMPLLLALPRSGTSGLEMMKVLTLGLGAMAAAGLLQALGNAGTLPPVVAAWSATLVFGVAGAVRLQQAETG